MHKVNQSPHDKGRVDSCLTDFAVVIDVERLIDRIDDVLDFIGITTAQILVAFDHVPFGHLPVRTS